MITVFYNCEELFYKEKEKERKINNLKKEFILLTNSFECDSFKVKRHCSTIKKISISMYLDGIALHKN